MNVVTTVKALREAREAMKGKVAFVPTMGYLHEGHRELMRWGRDRCDHLVVSIFVNPTQFEPGADLDSYPRDPEGDRRACEQEGCDLLFMPSVEEMYPAGDSTFVEVGELDAHLCGARRPGHFRGVATVVSKFFHMVQPHEALFGEKDWQQLAIIARMVRDLAFAVEIVAVPTVREPDGLALSSRNRYLDGEARRDARALSRGLAAAHAAYQSGERAPEALIQAARSCVEAVAGARIDYIECVDPDTLSPFQSDPGPAVLMALAVHLGGARLIDNLRLDRPLPKELDP